MIEVLMHGMYQLQQKIASLHNSIGHTVKGEANITADYGVSKKKKKNKWAHANIDP